MPNAVYSLLIVAVVALVTALLRFLPFFIFSNTRPIPKWIVSLGEKLPYAIMAMLVVYCLKDLSFAAAQNWLPAAISVAVVFFAHLWKRNTLLSIISGTVCYMLLLRFLA